MSEKKFNITPITINRHSPFFLHSAFTLVELLLIVSIIAILTAILLPALSKAKDTALDVKCKGNLKQIGLAALAYTEDNDDWSILASMVHEGVNCHSYQMLWLLGYIPEKSAVFNCPSEPLADSDLLFKWEDNRNSYGYNFSTFGYADWSTNYPPRRIREISKFGNNSNLIYFADSTPNAYVPGSNYFSECISPPYLYPNDGNTQQYCVYTRHKEKKAANSFFLDGHADSLDWKQLKNWKYWTPTMRGTGNQQLWMFTGPVW